MNLSIEDKLVLLVEECGEVIQAATKCLRFGYHGNHIPEYGINSEVLAREIGDLFGVIDSLPLNPVSIQENRIAKITKAELAKAKYGPR